MKIKDMKYIRSPFRAISVRSAPPSLLNTSAMGAAKINDITSDIELTAFTYLDDNDFLDGNYRGNSKFTTIIKKK